MCLDSHINNKYHTKNIDIASYLAKKIPISMSHAYGNLENNNISD